MKEREVFNKVSSIFKDRFFVKVCTLVSLPVLIVIFFLVTNTITNSNNYKKLLNDGYLERLESMCRGNEETLNNITASVHILTQTPDFKAAVFANDTTAVRSMTDLKDMFIEIKNNNSIINNVCLYNKNNGLICSQDGIYRAEGQHVLRKTLR